SARRRSRSQPDPRASGIRPQRSALRSCRSQPARRVRRPAYPQHRRLVRRRNEQPIQLGASGAASDVPGSGPMNPPMNMSSGATPESPLSSHSTAPAHIPATQRIYWSIRRELWEHRSIYIAPLAAAAIFLFGFLVALPHHMRGVKTLDQAHQVLDKPYELSAALIMGTAFIVGIFYSLDALY